MKSMPLHERIRSEVESQILSGCLGPGDRIPSEAELMEIYGCSRMTVSKAISSLGHAGLVERRKRAGTIVARRRTESMVLDVADLPTEVASRGQIYRYGLVDRRIRTAISGNSHEQRLVGKGKILIVRGVHFADDKPFAYEERLISLSAVPPIEQADFTSQPPGSWLLHHIPWTEAEHRIGAEGADAAYADMLAVPVGAACLTVERRTWRGDEGITFVRQIFVAGMHELVARFGATQSQC